MSASSKTFGPELGVKPPGLGRTLTFYSCFQASHYKPHGSAPHVGVFQFYSVTKLLTSSAHITPSALVRLKSSCGMLSGYEEPNLHDLAFFIFSVLVFFSRSCTWWTRWHQWRNNFPYQGNVCTRAHTCHACTRCVCVFLDTEVEWSLQIGVMKNLLMFASWMSVKSQSGASFIFIWTNYEAFHECDTCRFLLAVCLTWRTLMKINADTSVMQYCN